MNQTLPIPLLSDVAPFGEIDVESLILTKLLVQANSGGGKSYAIRRLAEQIYGHAQQLIFDPDGEFHTLREKFGFVLAGEGGDCPATIESAALLARKLLELGVSAVIDISALGARRPAFVRRFLESMMSAPRSLWHPLIVYLDEAHKFCPEKGETDAESTDVVNELASDGRKRGFGVVMATQRISKLNKNACAELNNKLIGRTALDTDLKRAASELGMAKKDWDKLRTLSNGTFFAFGPAFVSHGIERLKIGKVATRHIKAGTGGILPTPPPEHVRDMLGQLHDLPAEAEAEAKTVEQLRARVKELESGRGSDAAALLGGMSFEAERELANARLRRIEELTADIAELRAERDHIAAEIARVEQIATGVGKWRHAHGHGRKDIDAARRLDEIDYQAEAAPVVIPVRQNNHAKVAIQQVAGDLSKLERALLTVLARNPDGLSRAKLLVLAGYRPSGNVSTAFARLSSEGFISGSGGRFAITSKGIVELGPLEQLPTGKALFYHLMSSKKISELEKKLLNVVQMVHPRSIMRANLLEHAGYKPSGNISTALAHLKACGFVTVDHDTKGLRLAKELADG